MGTPVALMNAPSQIPRLDRKRGCSVRVLLALWAVAAFVFFAAPADRAAAQTEPTDPSTPVTIPDANLRAKLESVLGKSSGAPITRADMARLTSTPRQPGVANWAARTINLNRAGIRDLTGLEYAINLFTLNLERNEISDLRPLAGLTQLATLALSYNRISDLTPLAGLTSLQSLNIRHNRISDLTPLAGLTALSSLNFDDNRVTDLTPLARLTQLTNLTISDNPMLTDLTPLNGLSLERLFAGGTRITDLSPLRNMNTLYYLVLTGCQFVTDLSPLSGLTGLDRLSIDGLSIEDISPLVAASQAFQGTNLPAQIDLRDNPNLNENTAGHLVTLRGRGINVFTSTPLTLNRTVRGLKVTPGVTALTVEWRPLTTAPSFNPRGYTVQWRHGTQHTFRTTATPPRHMHVMGLGTTSYTIPNLTPGVEYLVRIRSYGTYGPPSAQVSGKPLLPDISIVVNIEPAVESLDVSWNAVSNADSYTVQWKSGEQEYDPSRQETVAGGDTTTYTIPNLTPGVEYLVRVNAKISVAYSPFSAYSPFFEESSTPLPAPLPGKDPPESGEDTLSQVIIENVEAGKKSLTVSWKAVSNAERYVVQWKSGEQKYDPSRQETVAGGDTTTYTIRGLIPDIEYHVRVSARADDRKEGKFSKPESGRPLPDPVEQSRVLGMVMAGVGRTLASDAVEILSSRSGTPVSRLHVTLGGQVLRLTDPPGWDSSPPAGSPSPLAGEERGEGAAPVTPGPSPWQRVTGVAIGVARALGVTVDGPSPLPGGSRGEGRSIQGAQNLPTRFPAGALRRSTGDSPLRVQPVSVKELLARSAFDLPLTGTGKDGVPAWTLWGRGAASGFSGQPQDDFTMTGSLYSGYVGVDYRPKPAMLLGLAVAHSTGSVDYTLIGSSNAAVDVEITSILPYAHWQPTPSLGVWSMVGAGWGDVAVETAGAAGMRRTTDLSFWMGAVGGRQALTTWQGIDLAAKTDAFLTTVKSDGKVDLAAARGLAQRMRLLMEGRTAVDLSPVSQVQPRLEVGWRWDGGTAEQGLGLELGGGLAYTQTAWGLSINTQGRYLLAHEDGDFEDWGASLDLRLDPGDRGQGAWLTVTPVWGRAASGTQQLWENARVLESVGGGTRAAASGWQPQRLDVDIGYGIALAGSTRTVTPYGGLAMTGPGTSRYRLGGRVELLVLRMGLNVEGERANQPGRSPSHGVSVNFDWQW